MNISSDILACLVLIAAVSGALLWGGMRIGARKNRWLSGAFAGIAALVLVIYATWLKDNPVLTHVLPVADVFLLGNLQMPAAALLAGVAWSSIQPNWQRTLLISALLVIGLWREGEPLIGRPPADHYVPLDQRRLPANFHVLLLRRRRRYALKHIWHPYVRSRDGELLPNPCCGHQFTWPLPRIENQDPGDQVDGLGGHAQLR